MANIPQNDTYQSTGGTPIVSPSFKYTPSTTYQNLAKIKGSTASPFAAAPPAMPGTADYFTAKQAGISQYGNLVNNGMGIPTQTSFLPPIGDPHTAIPIPSDYGSFMSPTTIDSNGEKLSWGTPTTPVIRNIPGDANGQYVQDTSNPDLLVKTVRGSNPVADRAIKDGRPGFMYQIDHIMPLELGGADTLANRQLITADQNDQKTKAQAIPYTLYAHGDISLSEARAMAMQWKDRDVTDVPQPNGIGLVSDTKGKTGIEIARETAQRWTQPKATTVKDVIAGIPDAMKDLGKGWLPDPVREFIKGFGSGATLGFLPYEQGENEGTGSWLAGKIGQVAGGVGSFLLGGELIGGALALGGVARGAIGAYRGVAAVEAARAGFQTAEVAEGIAAGAKTAETTFKTLNKAPGYLQKILTPQAIKTAGKFAATNALVGQGQQFIGNHFNPYTLGGTALEQDQQHMIRNIFTDLSVGALSGIGSPTIKGTAYAAMLPLTLSYLANPDDPVDAITNGVIFGALHATGSMKSPGYNNIEMMGGKPYQSPVTKAFEDTVNKASYASLSHYAPDVYPTLKPGETVPATAHAPETVQAAKDTAVENVWKRFFFGKDVAPAAQQKTLEDFKGFSQDLDTTLDSSKNPVLSGLSRLSRSARKAATATTKAQNTNIKDTFGKDYQTKNEFKGDTSAIPEDGMDLQTALTEIKRITVASRQLYKGGLTGELRNKADVDDLLSFGKSSLQNRFDSMEKFANPPIAKQAIDSIDDTFMKRSFNNSGMDPEGGKYPNGDIALTGAALKINKEGAKYFFDQKNTGNASPNILLVDRSDTAPLWRMRNQLMDKADIASNKYAPDPNPENALQAFGVVKNPQSGQKELVPLGWVASDFRLNQATGEGHTAFNQHELVKKYQETGGAEGMRPIDLHKDQIAPSMRKEGISVLVANLDPRATIATIETGNPFIPVNINDANWTYSKALGDRLSQQENKNPISMDVAKVSNAIGAKQKAAAIAQMNKNITRPASAHIPTSVTPVNPKTDRVTVPREATRDLLQQVEASLDVAGPAQVKDAFKNNFGILLQDGQAAEIFAKRNELTMRDGVKILVDAVNQGDVDSATKVKLQFAKTYLESGSLQASDGGKAVPDMLLLGKMKNNARRGQEEHTVLPDFVTPSAPQTSPNSARLTPEAPQVTPNTPEVISNTQEPSTRVPSQNAIPASVTPSEPPSGGLLDRIVSTAQSEMPPTAMRKKAPLLPAVSPAGGDAQSLVKNYLPEGKAAIEEALPPGQRYTAGDDTMVKAATRRYADTHDSVIRGMESRIQNDLVDRNIPQPVIDEVKQQVRSELQNHSSLILGMNEPSSRNTPLPKPSVKSSEFYKFIDDGVANVKEPPAHYFAKTFDEVFKTIYGPKYKGKIELAKVLSTMTKEGSGFWDDIFFSDKNSSGREIQQNRDIVNARASGDRDAEKNAYSERRKQLEANKTGEGGNLTDAEKAELGLDPGEFVGGMRVVPWYQDDNMVGDLTRGENLMSGVVSDHALTGASAVRDAKRIFIGVGKDSPGLLQYINNLRTQADPKAKKLSIPSSLFDKLENEAKGADAKKALKEHSDKAEITEAEEQLPKLKLQLERIIADIKGDPENPPPSWQTPEMLQGDLKDITEKMAKFSKIMADTKDGGGGPGKHDGAGGPGAFFGSLASSVGKAAQGAADYLTGTTRYVRPPDPVKPASYKVRGVDFTDDDINAIAPIIFGEVSNRPQERQDFETRHIINTGINRIANNPKNHGYGATLTEVFQKPGQYNAYAPKGTTVSGGKVVPSQYQLAQEGKLDAASQKRYQLVKDVLNEMKSGNFEDTTGGKMFYTNASDGTIWLGSTSAEAVQNAKNHEHKLGLAKTPFHTQYGMPAE